MVKSKSYQDYLIESLKDPVEAANYLNAALEDGDYNVIATAVRNVVKANYNCNLPKMTAGDSCDVYLPKEYYKRSK